MPTPAPTAIDTRDLKRRHPLCPSCGYDLVATLAANKRICPECGEDFELSDLAYERRKGDWSIARALKLGASALAIRSALGLVVVVALVLLSLFSMLSFNLAILRLLPFALAIAQGCLLGWIFSHKLVEQAGFESVLLMIAACTCAALVSALGYVIAARLAGVGGGFVAVLHNSISMLIAWLWIVHRLLLDE